MPLKHSKNEVRKATAKLVENKIGLEEKLKAIEVLANFRSSYAYPMQSMLVHFTNKAQEVDKKAITISRLKRIPSILNKMRRFKNMQVTSMGDIGGIRIITKNLNSVTKIRDNIRKSRTRNKFIGEKNYLENPKESGYRGIHLNYSYQGTKSDYKNFRIELQIRSFIQHAWATTVEVVGTFQKQNLKASQGDEKWLHMFKIISLAFACLEKQEDIDKNLVADIRKQAEELKIKDTLLSFSIVTHELNEKNGYYLITLNVEKGFCSTQYFKEQFIEIAKEQYQTMEKEYSDNDGVDIVLVSAKSLKDLKKSYPNYFADTLLFLETLDAIVTPVENKPGTNS